MKFLVGIEAWQTPTAVCTAPRVLPSQHSSLVLSPSLALVTAAHRSSWRFFRAPSDTLCKLCQPSSYAHQKILTFKEELLKLSVLPDSLGKHSSPKRLSNVCHVSRIIYI